MATSPDLADLCRRPDLVAVYGALADHFQPGVNVDSAEAIGVDALQGVVPEHRVALLRRFYADVVAPLFRPVPYRVVNNGQTVDLTRRVRTDSDYGRRYGWQRPEPADEPVWVDDMLAAGLSDLRGVRTVAVVQTERWRAMSLTADELWRVLDALDAPPGSLALVLRNANVSCRDAARLVSHPKLRVLDVCGTFAARDTGWISKAGAADRVVWLERCRLRDAALERGVGRRLLQDARAAHDAYYDDADGPAYTHTFASVAARGGDTGAAAAE